MVTAVHVKTSVAKKNLARGSIGARFFEEA